MSVGKLSATIRSFDRSFAVVAPAFPGMQRVVQNGVLKWQDHFTAGKIDVGDLLEKQGIPRGQIWVADAVRRNASFVESAAKAGSPSQPRIIVVDCRKQADLEDLVSCTFPHRHRCLWVGSAGLGLALAGKVGTCLSQRPAPVLRNGSILFWIGSTHPVSSDNVRFWSKIRMRCRVRWNRAACRPRAGSFNRGAPGRYLEAGSGYPSFFAPISLTDCATLRFRRWCSPGATPRLWSARSRVLRRSG